MPKVCRTTGAGRSVPSQPRDRLSSRGAMKATLETRRRTDKRTPPPGNRSGASRLAFELDDGNETIVSIGPDMIQLMRPRCTR